MFSCQPITLKMPLASRTCYLLQDYLDTDHIRFNVVQFSSLSFVVVWFVSSILNWTQRPRGKGGGYLSSTSQDIVRTQIPIPPVLGTTVFRKRRSSENRGIPARWVPVRIPPNIITLIWRSISTEPKF